MRWPVLVRSARTAVAVLASLLVARLFHVEFANQGWREYAGRWLDELTGSGWQAVIHPADISKFVKEWNAARAAGKALLTKGDYSRYQRRPPHGPPATDERS